MDDWMNISPFIHIFHFVWPNRKSNTMRLLHLQYYLHPILCNFHSPLTHTFVFHILTPSTILRTIHLSAKNLMNIYMQMRYNCEMSISSLNAFALYAASTQRGNCIKRALCLWINFSEQH